MDKMHEELKEAEKVCCKNCETYPCNGLYNCKILFSHILQKKIDALGDFHLKDCPFCKAEAKLKIAANGVSSVLCTAGCVETKNFASPEEAIEHWNTRF